MMKGVHSVSCDGLESWFSHANEISKIMMSDFRIKQVIRKDGLRIFWGFRRKTYDTLGRQKSKRELSKADAEMTLANWKILKPIFAEA